MGKIVIDRFGFNGVKYGASFWNKDRHYVLCNHPSYVKRFNRKAEFIIHLKKIKKLYGQARRNVSDARRVAD